MKLRRIAVAVAVVTSGLAGTAFTATPASAEVAEVQQTWWGLATKGESRVLDGWRNDPLGWAVEPNGGAMFVGGQFLDITNGTETIRQPYLAAFDAGDGRPLRWITPEIGGPVLALETTPDGGLMVGGEMDSVNGVNLGALAKIDPTTGDLWPGWTTRVYGSTSVVRDIRVESDGWMYVVGDFSVATEGNNPFPVNGAIRMDPATGSIDRNWTPDVAGGSVWGVSVSQTNNRVYLAGWFTSINGDTSARGFAGLDDVTGAVLDGRDTVPYNTCVGCDGYYLMYDVLATEFGDVWVVGQQHAIFILDEALGLDMRLMHYTGCNRHRQDDCKRAGGEYQEIERVGDRIYAACHCWGWHQTDTQTIYHSSFPTGTPTGSISSVAAYEPSTGERIQSMNPYMSGNAGGFAIAGATDGCLWLAGGYTQVGQPGDQRRARDLVRLCDANGPGPDPQPNPVDPGAPSDVAAPAVCSADHDGVAATISWTASPGAVDYRLFRSIDDGATYWRGVTVETSFPDALSGSGRHRYEVQARGVTGVWSDSAVCSPDLDPLAGIVPVAAPATCSASNAGTMATVSWDASENAVQYRVFRSIDGGPTYWRAATDATSTTDKLRTSGLHHYQVQARGADGVWSVSTQCGAPLDPIAGLEAVAAPANCLVMAVGSAATVTWEPSPDSVDSRIFRSVDGGTSFWRGLVTGSTFSDTLRPSGVHVYTVQSRGDNGLWSESVTCSNN